MGSPLSNHLATNKHESETGSTQAADIRESTNNRSKQGLCSFDRLTLNVQDKGDENENREIKSR